MRELLRNPRRLGAVVALAACAGLAGTDRASAEASGPDFFRVVGVASDDVLNIRADAGASHAKIGEIPPDTDGIRNLGCVGGLSFAEWQAATEAERAEAARSRWCKIAYGGIEGWVAGRFLGEGAAPEPMGEGSLWRIVEIDGAPTSTDAELGFEADGDFYGTVGCNRFRGRLMIESGQLRADGPVAATQMACVEPGIGEQERRILAIIADGSTIGYDPRADAMTLTDADGKLAVRLTRRPR
ncbi:META domain-containing protein [Limibaculum sp. M0105]|uniref:META domain-containing protein n=1 Tax=Thermohalobaculum xanthum TaxID=2753746 RepID=A0A8J7SD60_9RHOB|nr:META domain-containing protein [Thermohalobaculum xanthum]MBK0399028.1 META domain-containing protein [Thermohalobaculum xanthum]